MPENLFFAAHRLAEGHQFALSLLLLFLFLFLPIFCGCCFCFGGFASSGSQRVGESDSQLDCQLATAAEFAAATFLCSNFSQTLWAYTVPIADLTTCCLLPKVCPAPSADLQPTYSRPCYLQPTLLPAACCLSCVAPTADFFDFAGCCSCWGLPASSHGQRLGGVPTFLAIKDAGHAGSTSKIPGHRSETMIPGNESKSDNVAVKHTSFAGLFSNNRKLTTDNKLVKFEVGDETLKLETNDLIDVRTKLGHCLVGYIAGKFPDLKRYGLFLNRGGSFQLHDSGWLIFRFAKDEDRQRILAGGPYFVYGRPLLLKNMPGCFEFKEDDISLTPVWATLPSLPLECWHPNALGKIGSRLGTPIAMDALTMKMERVSYARILVEVDASKKLVDHVEFILPNGVVRKQPIVYEFTPKFCSTCHRFGHLQESCQPPAIPAVTATALPCT
ncbi:UNVERIFIED_CONTAM: hypothetical protein Sangu_2665000 [Sesamum angustifolium]|uniref:DUF4283 domain-containing protein n=1 Tax=Sesamum angustifolium TaxID=2727405 RepID=A0AAW2J1I7_9LAMI